jgi:hypothetical protein
VHAKLVDNSAVTPTKWKHKTRSGRKISDGSIGSKGGREKRSHKHHLVAHETQVGTGKKFK